MRTIHDAHLLDLTALFQQAQTQSLGLDSRQAQLRLEDDGPNVLPGEAKPSFILRLLNVLNDPMVLVLLAAAFLSALLGEWMDSLVIAVVIFINAVLELYQEGKAARTVEALSHLNAPKALVRRDGELKEVSGEDLVIGDIVLLKTGDTVPADIRLTKTMELKVDQSSLTGESLPVEKDAQVMTNSPASAERHNMVYLGSPVLAGRGEGVVVARGAETATGRIAGLLAETAMTETPLQKKLAELSRILSIGVMIICLLVFLLGLVTSSVHTASALLDQLMLAISLAVAAIPEGMVVVVTLVLSLGMKIMSRRGAVVRRLNAVETLGATQVICSDKTGTLTENKMQVQRAWQVTEEGKKAAALCSSIPEGSHIGDPTELAILDYAEQEGFHRPSLLQEKPLVKELPFDSKRKRMSTIHRQGKLFRQYVKGAPEILLSRCLLRQDKNGSLLPLTERDRRHIRAEMESMAAQALRVLALAWRDCEAPPQDEEKLVFAGLLGLEDPPRPGVKKSLQQAAKAGIRTVMVSGDSPETAKAIGEKLGLVGKGMVCTGEDLDKMDDGALEAALPMISVFARVKPEDKLRIVRLWQKRGAVTAMTGDGVNDAPALKAADIGVGMGLCGSEVSRRAASLVLTDDDFSTIILAVQEGRRIYANIRKALQFLLASNLAEVIVIFIGSLLGWKIFLPIHLLWINLITDCFPAIALGMEAPEPDLMDKPPRDPKESVLGGGMAKDILWQGSCIGLLTLLSFFLGSRTGQETAMTMAFLTLASGEICHAWNLRSRFASSFTLPHKNPWLNTAMLASLGLNLLLLYLPFLETIFRVVALSPLQALTALFLAFLIIPVVELVKALRRRGR